MPVRLMKSHGDAAGRLWFRFLTRNVEPQRSGEQGPVACRVGRATTSRPDERRHPNLCLGAMRAPGARTSVIGPTNGSTSWLNGNMPRRLRSHSKVDKAGIAIP